MSQELLTTMISIVEDRMPNVTLKVAGKRLIAIHKNGRSMFFKLGDGYSLFADGRFKRELRKFNEMA